jgi:hypothetical protein
MKMTVNFIHANKKESSNGDPRGERVREKT